MNKGIGFLYAVFFAVLICVSLLAGCGQKASVTPTPTPVPPTPTSEALKGTVMTIEGLATNQSISTSSIRMNAVSMWANATIECGYEDSTGKFHVVGTTESDGNGKYLITGTFPTTETYRNMTLRGRKAGETFRAVLGLITSDATNYAPMIGKDSEIRHKILDLILLSGISREAIDYELIEEKATKIITSMTTAELTDLANAFRYYQTAETSVFDANYLLLQTKYLSLYKTYVIPARQAAIALGQELSDIDMKNLQSSIEAQLALFAVGTLGLDLTTYNSYLSQLDTQLGTMVVPSNPMNTIITNNTNIDRVTRAITNKVSASKLLAQYLGITLPASFETPINASLETLATKVGSITTAEVNSACYAAFSTLYDSYLWQYTIGSGSHGAKTVNPNSLVQKLFHDYLGQTTTTQAAALWTSIDAVCQLNKLDPDDTNPNIWITKMQSMQTAALGYITAFFGVLLPDQHGVTRDQISHALVYIMGPAE